MIDVRIAAVIPAFNVGNAIEQVLRDIPDQLAAIVVVDDGSTDDTAARVARSAQLDQRVHLVRHERNRGVGAAMVTGLRKSLDLEADIVVKIDGDGQMPVSLVTLLVQPLLTGEGDYTKGNKCRDLTTFREMRELPSD